MGTVGGPGVGGIGEHSRALIDAVVAAIPGWVERTVGDRMRGADLDASRLDTEIAEVGSAMARSAREALTGLLSLDVERQRTNPLQELRQITGPMTDLLRAAGVPEARRDEFDSRSFPRDAYSVGPLSWRDLGEEVHEAGIVWGAWKAATVISRHRRGGGPS